MNIFVFSVVFSCVIGFKMPRGRGIWPGGRQNKPTANIPLNSSERVVKGDYTVHIHIKTTSSYTNFILIVYLN